MALQTLSKKLAQVNMRESMRACFFLVCGWNLCTFCTLAQVKNLCKCTKHAQVSSTHEEKACTRWLAHVDLREFFWPCVWGTGHRVWSVQILRGLHSWRQNKTSFNMMDNVGLKQRQSNRYCNKTNYLEPLRKTRMISTAAAINTCNWQCVCVYVCVALWFWGTCEWSLLIVN